MKSQAFIRHRLHLAQQRKQLIDEVIQRESVSLERCSSHLLGFLGKERDVYRTLVEELRRILDE